MEAPDAHLHIADPVMAGLIDEYGGPLPMEPDSRGRPDDYYGALVRTIAGQQLSVKAARSIYNRLTDRFGGRTPTPAELLADDPDELRIACGFSRAKTQYLRSLAEHVLDGSLELDRLHELPDEEVIRELTAVKGIGEWSAHMFLMFTLHRPDVLPTGDLGVRNAAMRAYQLDAPRSRRNSRTSPRSGAPTAPAPASTSGEASTTRPSTSATRSGRAGGAARSGRAGGAARSGRGWRHASGRTVAPRGVAARVAPRGAAARRARAGEPSPQWPPFGGAAASDRGRNTPIFASTTAKLR